ncbi:MAG: hypothetical protein PG978_000628 [Wolbachia endosymbiont of Ctenocephalides felis wCfeF]|nr:MAG: hypothetical protein PG978_000628 [Wolbachia endosymbiont of Ctenocephalides felis wCfeF]
MKTLRNTNEKDITYESACGELTNKDQEKILKLARKIEEGKGIAKKFKNGVLRKSHYNAKKILATKITYRGETFTLLDHAKLYKNNQAINDILQEAKKQKLSESILSVKANKERQILPPIVVTETATDIEATIAEDENSKKVLDPNTTAIEHQDTIPEINNTGAISADAELCKDVNKNSEDLDNMEQHQPIHENSEGALNPIETITQELSESPIGIITEDQTQSCSYSKSEKESAENKKEKSSKKATHQKIIVGSVGTALLVMSVASYVLKMPIIAVIGGIVGLVCISFALYDILKPNTKLEEIEKTEQLDVKSFFDSKELTI